MGDTARSDLALTIAALLIGPALLAPLGSGGGVAGAVGTAVVLLTVTAVVPILLGRSRGDLPEALALRGGPRSGWPGAAAAGPWAVALGRGLPLAVPAALAGAFAMRSAGATTSAAALGRLSGSLLPALPVLAAGTGTAVLITFLAVRARAAAVRSPDWSLHRLVRTVGTGAAVVALVTGLIRAPSGASAARTAVHAAALLVTVLLADRLVGAGRVPRLAVLLPAVVVAWSHLSAAGLVAGLHAAALGAGTATVMATVALGPHGIRAVVPLALAVHLWPTCLSPLARVGGLC
jgi:hypothetical protein